MELFRSVALLSLSHTLWRNKPSLGEGTASMVFLGRTAVLLFKPTHHRWKEIVACRQKSLVPAYLPTFPSSQLGGGPDAVIPCFLGAKSSIYLGYQDVEPWPHVATWCQLLCHWYDHQHWTKCSSSSPNDWYSPWFPQRSVVLRGANHAKGAVPGRTFSLWADMDELSESSITYWMIISSCVNFLLWYRNECSRQFVPVTRAPGGIHLSPHDAWHVG